MQSLDERIKEIINSSGPVTKEQAAHVLRYAQDLRDRADELKKKGDSLERREEEWKVQSEKLGEAWRSLETREGELSSLRGECTELKRKNKELVEGIERGKEAINDLTKNLNRTQAERDTLQGQVNKLREQLDEERRGHDELQRNSEKATRERERERERADGLAQRVNIAETKQREAEERADVRKKLEQRIWPECIRVKVLEPFREEWTKEIQSSEPDRTLMLMFAYIFAWSSACDVVATGDSVDSTTDATMKSSLFNFSKTLFRWLMNHGRNCQEAHAIFTDLAENLNAKMDGSKCRIEVPSLGSFFASRSMIPSRSGSSTGYVEAVEAWAVRSDVGYENKASVKLR